MLNIFFIQKLFTILLTEKRTVLSPAKLLKNYTHFFLHKKEQFYHLQN